MTFSTVLGFGRRTLAGALLLLGTACHQDGHPELARYTFEENTETRKGTSSEQAYAGAFALKAVGPRDTVSFRFPARLLGPVRHLRLSAQVWLGHSTHQYPPLQIQVWRGQERLDSRSLWLSRVVWRYEQWVPVSTLFSIPRLEPGDELRVSLTLNQPDFKVYLDDFTLLSAE